MSEILSEMTKFMCLTSAILDILDILDIMFRSVKYEILQSLTKLNMKPKNLEF